MEQIIILEKNIFKNAHGIKIIEDSPSGINGIYFRNYEKKEEEIIYHSYLIQLDEEILKDIDISLETIEIKEKHEIHKLKKWSKKVKTRKKREKVTKEVAQKRLDELLGERRFEVIKWEKTNSPATIKCLECEGEITFKAGQSIYSFNNFGGFKGKCGNCLKKIRG